MRFLRLSLLGIAMPLFALPAQSNDVVMVFEGTGEIARDEMGIFTFGTGPQPVNGMFSFDDAESTSCIPSGCHHPVDSFVMTVGGAAGQVFTATLGAEVWTRPSPNPEYGIDGWFSSASAYVPFMRITVTGPAFSGLPDFDLMNPEVTGTSVAIEYVDDLYRRSSFEGVLTILGEQSTGVSDTSWGRLKERYR